MINEDTFRTLIHTDEAFKALLEKEGALAVKEQLQQMQMKLSTQIATFGDERPDWFRRANSLLVVVRNRMDEAKDYEQSELAEYKEVLADALEYIRTQKGQETAPDVNDLDAVDAWLEAVGL